MLCAKRFARDPKNDIMNEPNLLDSSFRAIPTTPIVKPLDAPEPIEMPHLAWHGCRDYLRNMRKRLEQNLSIAKAGNRAQRRAFAGKLRFAV